MKNKNILAITLAVTMGFANAGIFDDIGNGIAGAADDVAKSPSRQNLSFC
jgi:hypothetical protein